MSTDMQVYGNKEGIVELQKRIIRLLPSLMPQSERLSHDEALALAQVAYLHGLSPFNQEIYYLKGKEGRSLGVMPGIRGYRKAARRQLGEKESYWLEFSPCNAQDAGLADDPRAVAVICFLRDSVTMGRYLAMAKEIASIYRVQTVGDNNPLIGFKDELHQIMGKPPVFIGYGIVRSTEFDRMKTARLSVNHQAEIRAERQALRLRFDLDMVGQMPASNGDEAEAAIADGVIEEDVVEVSAWDLPVGQDEAEVKIREDATADQSTSKLPAHVKGMKITPQDILDQGLAKDIATASWMWNTLCLVGKPFNDGLGICKLYCRWHATGLKGADAAMKTLAGEQPPQLEEK